MVLVHYSDGKDIKEPNVAILSSQQITLKKDPKSGRVNVSPDQFPGIEVVVFGETFDQRTQSIEYIAVHIDRAGVVHFRSR